MLNWLLGHKSVERMVADKQYEEAIGTIQNELGQSPPPDRSRDLRQVLAEALDAVGRKAEAASVLKDLAREHLLAGHSEKAIALQKRLERLLPAGDAGKEIDAIASAVSSAAPVADEARAAVFRSPLFGDFTKDELTAVIRGLKLHSLDPGEIVMIEGEPGDSLYVLTDGVLRVYVKGPSGKSTQISELEGGGTFFGEIAIVEGGARTATVTCLTHSEILELDRATVDRIVKDHPRVEQVLREFCGRRLKEQGEKRPPAR